MEMIAIISIQILVFDNIEFSVVLEKLEYNATERWHSKKFTGC